ncbi:MAG: iron-sulfur cluster assembly protein, partial [Myxococcota bacterium]
MSSLDANRVKDILKKVDDPIFDKDIVSYRIYRGCEVSGKDVVVKLAIPTHAYPRQARDDLYARIKKALEKKGADKVEV